MGRLDADIIERTERFAHRMVDVADSLAEQSHPRRVVDQLIGCGTSVGANAAEADEALSRADFCRILGVVVRELSESRFWLRFIAKRGWLPADRLRPLEEECSGLRRVFGSMIARIRSHDRESKAGLE